MVLLIIILLFLAKRKHNVHQLAQTFSCSYESRDLTPSLSIITPARQSVSQSVSMWDSQQAEATGMNIKPR